MTFDITASIVLYKSNREILNKAVRSFLDTSLRVKIYLVDNSPTDALRTFPFDDRIFYIFNSKNIGFGKAHNVAMRHGIRESAYHLVLNPDAYFNKGTLEDLFAYMEQHPDAGQIMPKILYPGGELQHLCKLLPAPADLFLRRFLPQFPGAAQRNRRYELIDSGYDKIMNIPNLSGCFMFFRTSALKEVGLFDERIFMYTEDLDLTRRMHMRYKTIFYPHVSVYHHYEKGSYKSFRLMLYNLHGALIYFTKWGWIFDRDRRRINDKVTATYLNTKDVQPVE